MNLFSFILLFLECRCCVGGPGKKLWSLAALLLRFITRGPHFVSSKKNPTTIGTLIVNVDKTEFPSLNPSMKI